MKACSPQAASQRIYSRVEQVKAPPDDRRESLLFRGHRAAPCHRAAAADDPVVELVSIQDGLRTPAAVFAAPGAALGAARGGTGRRCRRNPAPDAPQRRAAGRGAVRQEPPAAQRTRRHQRQRARCVGSTRASATLAAAQRLRPGGACAQSVRAMAARQPACAPLGPSMGPRPPLGASTQ